MSKGFYLGLMSGTSMDGIDACIASFGARPKLIATLHGEMPPRLQEALAALIQGESSSAKNPLERVGALDAELGELFAETALTLIASHRIPPADILAIGSHGQTVWHQPTGTHPFSLQLGDPARIAERTGITTVADFRRRDIAAGGQGAPLVPAFHAALFQAANEARVVLNLGGMANITLLPAKDVCDTDIGGFDTGPANVLLDLHAKRHLQSPCDVDGAWAAQGTPDTNLLQAMLADPYFSRPPPKSTGREHFNVSWLDRHLGRHNVSPVNVQATLAELTAQTVADAVKIHSKNCTRLLVCGGGVHNQDLMARLATRLPHCHVASTASYGIAPDWVEAMAFAWLAKQTLQGLAGNLPAVTGARHGAILGSITLGMRPSSMTS